MIWIIFFWIEFDQYLERFPPFSELKLYEWLPFDPKNRENAVGVIRTRGLNKSRIIIVNQLVSDEQ